MPEERFKGEGFERESLEYDDFERDGFDTRRERRAGRRVERRAERRAARREGAEKRAARSILEFVVILVVAFAVVFGIVRPFVVEAFYIPSESMVPTLRVNDRVLVNKFIYRISDPHRGDIVVFKSVEGDGSEDLIKRVVGVPGDEIEVRNGRLLVNGDPKTEPYINRNLPDRSFFGPERVPAGDVFAMGDNRANSQDSRFFGPVPQENLEGEAFLLFWPPGHFGSLL